MKVKIESISVKGFFCYSQWAGIAIIKIGELDITLETVMISPSQEEAIVDICEMLAKAGFSQYEIKDALSRSNI